ncbi:MAG: hypothetical protein MUF20_01580, partial [Methylotetracoccus sp.]|nr:hypothetical protein [Methylotetracoccus sp.]
ARSLVFAYVAAYIYEQDAPLAERKAQALTLDRTLLAELLGQAELRELLDEAVIQELEQDLQHLTEHRRARDRDEVHDLLRRVGDLTLDEIIGRCSDHPAAWLGQLTHEGRAAEVGIAGEKRWIAAEDAALYRDALGVMPPSGLPERFLANAERPLQRLCARYARTHGPFVTERLAQRYSLRPAQVDPVLHHLAQEGVLVRGEIRPGGVEPDWCDAEVLRTIKRRTLAKLRNDVAPLDSSVLGTFLPAWHGIGEGRGGPRRLQEAIGQLEGLPLPWSLLSQTVLPARVAGFTAEALDMLAATGAVVWVGRSPLGPADGRIALYRRDHASSLLEPPAAAAPGDPLHRAILDHLARRGASFLFELESTAREVEGHPSVADFKAALWDLVWAGLITNDTFAPLRSLGKREPRSSRTARRGGQWLAGGRWSLVANLVDAHADPTAKALARTQVLLERYGLVSREAVQAEDWPGGYGPVYKVLKTMEEAGKVRRGYFIEGLGGTQFGYGGAIDRLRGCKPGDAPVDEDIAPADLRVLAAADPANAYGSLLPWPDTAEEVELRARRVGGAWVVLWQGRPVLYAAQNGRHALLFDHPALPEAVWESAFVALAQITMPGRKGFLVIEKIDGKPVREAPLHQRLRCSGFESDPRGLVAGPGLASAARADPSLPNRNR